ncbi:MAG: hypothetical protein WD768_09865 [Phycisphaeraceae bacterium]
MRVLLFGDFFTAALFAALFYLQVNPSKVKAKINLMIAWFIFIGALAVTLLAAINDGFTKWITAIQATAFAVSIFFMLLSIDPSAKPNIAMPPQQPPQNPPQA